MKFYKKYRHVGYSHPSVPGPWVPIVEQAIIKIEKEMWPQWWLPMFVKRWIHYLATGNSVVRVKYWWAYNLRKKLTGGQSITQIKDKYATLRIYCNGNDKIYKIIEEAEECCRTTCEHCGSQYKVMRHEVGWTYNWCKRCFLEYVLEHHNDVDINELDKLYDLYYSNNDEHTYNRFESFCVDNGIMPDYR